MPLSDERDGVALRSCYMYMIQVIIRHTGSFVPVYFPEILSCLTNRLNKIMNVHREIHLLRTMEGRYSTEG